MILVGHQRIVPKEEGDFDSRGYSHSRGHRGCDGKRRIRRWVGFGFRLWLWRRLSRIWIGVVLNGWLRHWRWGLCRGLTSAPTAARDKQEQCGRGECHGTGGGSHGRMPSVGTAPAGAGPLQSPVCEHGRSRLFAKLGELPLAGLRLFYSAGDPTKRDAHQRLQD